MKQVYQNEEDTKVVGDTLEGMVREGARRMLAAALKEEVSAFPGTGPLRAGRGVPRIQERLSLQQGTDGGSVGG